MIRLLSVFFAGLFWSVLLYATSSASVPAFPGELLACSDTADCTSVEGLCGGRMIVNHKFATDLAASYREQAAAVDCTRPRESTPPPVLKCDDGFCGIRGEGAAAAKAWLARCPKAERQPAISSARNAKVKEALEQLDSPLNSLHLRGLKFLAHAGKDAAPAVPWITDLFVKAHNTPLVDQQCRIPNGLRDQNYLEALSDLGPVAKEAVPALQESFPGDSDFHSQEKLLELFAAIGPGAEAAAPLVLRELKKHTSEGLGDHRAALCIRALMAFGPAGRPGLKLLGEIVGKGGNYEQLAFQAMVAIAPENELTRSAAETILESRRGDTQVLGVRYFGFYHGDEPARLIQAARNSHYADMPRAVTRAIGNYGKDGKPFVGDLLSLQPKYSDASEFLVAVRKLDPRGERLAPLLEKPLLDAFDHRRSLELLVGLGTSQAWEATLSSLIRFSLGKKAGNAKLKDLQPQLLELIASPSRAPSFRMAAIQAMVYSGNDNAAVLAALKKAMEAPHQGVRWEASAAYLVLTGKPDERALRLQREALEEGSTTQIVDVTQVIRALPVLPETFEKWVVTICREPKPRRPLKAWAAAAAQHDGFARQEWIAEVSRKDSKLAWELIQVLGLTPDVPKALVEVLIPLHDQRGLADVVTEALENIGSSQSLTAARQFFVVPRPSGNA